MNLNSNKIKSILCVGLLTVSSVVVSCQNLEKRTSQPVKMIKDVPLNPRMDQGQVKKRLMILPFNDSKNVLSADMSRAIKRSLISELNRSPDIVAFDSKDLGIENVKASPQGNYDLKDVVKSLKQYTVHSALEVEVKDLKVKRTVPTKGIMKSITSEYECAVVVRIVNQGGRELLNHMKVVTYKDSGLPTEDMIKGDGSGNPIVPTLVKDTLFEFVPQITKSMETLVWEGRIASLQGERVFINVGKVSGLNVGDLLRVTEDGEEIFDTETGGFIGKSPGRLKGTLEVVSFFGQDGAIAVTHSGGGFRENDRVELY